MYMYIYIWVFFHMTFKIQRFHFATSTGFTNTYILSGQLLQGTHLCTWLVAGLESGSFGFRAQIANH